MAQAVPVVVDMVQSRPEIKLDRGECSGGGDGDDSA